MSLQVRPWLVALGVLACCTPSAPLQDAPKARSVNSLQQPPVASDTSPPLGSESARLERANQGGSAAAMSPSVGPEILVAPRALNQPLDVFVRAAIAEADADGRSLVVYVGATWCEPCRRFHDAVKAGLLDDALSGVRFLEFDHDAHQDGLKRAGYLKRFVPLFAIPKPDGHASERLHQGAVRGPGAVDFIMPRLSALLGRTEQRQGP